MLDFRLKTWKMENFLYVELTYLTYFHSTCGEYGRVELPVKNRAALNYLNNFQ